MVCSSEMITPPNVVALKETLYGYPVPSLPNFKAVDHQEFKKHYRDGERPFDVALQTNIANRFKPHLTHDQKWYSMINDMNKLTVVMESAIFRQNSSDERKNAYYRFGWHHFLRHKANFNNQNSPSDRWKKIQQEQRIEIKDWRTNGEYILLMLQKEYDSSLIELYEKYKNYNDWVKETLTEIRKHTDRPILIRSHPRISAKGVEKVISDFKNVTLSANAKAANMSHGGKHLAKDFENAYCVVGYTSNSLTESVCEGIPTFCLSPGAMAYDVSNTNLSQIETPNREINRTQWLYDMAYAQWHYTEVKSGKAWEHIKLVYFP